jgi:putative transposase
VSINVVGAALRRSSLEIVDGERPSTRAISRTPPPRARKTAISSRSANDRYRPDGGPRATDGIPPPSRNHRTPTAADTPAWAAASSLDSPRAIAAQNRWRCSFRPAGGRPGDRIADRPARSDRRLLLAPIATPLARALQRPLESAQYTALIFGQRCHQAGIDRSMGARGCALDNAVSETFFASIKKEKLNRRSWPTRQAARNAVFAWIEGWYNRRRLHSTLGYLSPADYENRTLIDGGTSLAASRLAPTSEMIKEKAA